MFNILDLLNWHLEALELLHQHFQQFLLSERRQMKTIVKIGLTIQSEDHI